MADLLSLSSRVIDSGVVDEPVNRVTNELSEVADGLAVVESFSHSVVLGFTLGAAVVIALGQLPNLLGIQIGDHFNGVFLGHGLRSNGHKGHQNSP